MSIENASTSDLLKFLNQCAVELARRAQAQPEAFSPPWEKSESPSDDARPHERAEKERHARNILAQQPKPFRVAQQEPQRRMALGAGMDERGVSPDALASSGFVHRNLTARVHGVITPTGSTDPALWAAFSTSPTPVRPDDDSAE